MRLLRKVGIPLLAILILLALLLAAVVLIYEQKGILLPFASHPDTDTTASQPIGIEYVKESIINPNWRILK